MHIGKSKKKFSPKLLRFDSEDCYSLDITLATILATALRYFYISGCPAIAMSKERLNWWADLKEKEENNTLSESDIVLWNRLDNWGKWAEYFKSDEYDLFKDVVRYMADYFKEYADGSKFTPQYKKDDEYRPDGIDMLCEVFGSLWN